MSSAPAGPAIADDDIPLAQLLVKRQLKRVLPKSEPIAKKEPLLKFSNRLLDDDVPLAEMIKRKNSVEPAKKGSKAKEPPRQAEPVAVRAPEHVPKVKEAERHGEKMKEFICKKEAKNSQEPGDCNRWWEDPSYLESDEIKWESLEHSGVLFPPPYVPHGVPLRYSNRELVLPPDVEEIASFFGALLETDHAKNETFCRNFFSDFQEHLHAKHPVLRKEICEFEKCDFTLIHQYLQTLKEQKRLHTKEEKESAKEEKKKIEEKFGFCLLNGRREKVGNFRVEPPGLFRGRGQHPKTGKLKLRVQPEQITLNLGPGAPIPDPPEGHSWGRIISNNQVTWLACWTENINQSMKYVFFAATSSLKGQSDLKKFEKARELRRHIGRIRDLIKKELLMGDQPQLQQRATALWLIDRLALRAGNEKNDDEADTVGCCSLRCEHVSLAAPDSVTFDFLGKDSIRYTNQVRVDRQVFKNLKQFMRGKAAEDSLFDKLSVSSLNSYLNTLMPGLTAKVFRTFNASFTFTEELKRSAPSEDLPVQDKLLAYNRSNRQVAILCNHQRSVPKSHGSSMARIEERIRLLKLERVLIRRVLRDTFSAKDPDALADESDFDDETLDATQQRYLELKTAKAAAKSLDSQPVSQSDLEDGLSGKTEERLRKMLSGLGDKIAALKVQRTDRDECKATALGTSKINYLDPRISIAWCKRHSVPIEKIFNKTLREKFQWSLSVASDWVF